ncbi:MAG: RuBisCO accumulation factor 1 [Cyanobacteriota bacterium]
MTEVPPQSPDHQPEENLLLLLRRKQGSWVEWGKACQQLQKTGYSSQKIFEETGFEPIQQNQIIVASQVHTTLINAGVSDAVRSRFERTGSDTLYELRILTQSERADAAEFIVARNLDSEGAREVAKAIKEFSRRSTLPEGFSIHPGDIVAFEYWKLARQQNDLQERSRLIARGLMFAHTQEARQKIETLLTEFAGGKQRSAPRLPFYRFEVDEQQPCLLPVAGQLPLKSDELKQVSSVNSTGSFQVAHISGQQMLVAVPGWQVILKAQDPVGILCNSNQLLHQKTGPTEEVLAIIDRKETQWDSDSYFAVDKSGQLEIQWFPENPDATLLGRLILVLRPKRIFDEALSQDVWQIDE